MSICHNESDVTVRPVFIMIRNAQLISLSTQVIRTAKLLSRYGRAGERCGVWAGRPDV